MARYIDAKCRLCRREGVKLFLKGERCFSPKCPLSKKGAVPPGQHGPKRARKLSDYGQQLREKQKAKRFYGVMERQFVRLFKRALKSKAATGLRLLQILESRLDNIVYRGGLTLSRSTARQLVCHGFCLVDGKKVDLPSFEVKVGQVVSLNVKGQKLDAVKKALAAKQPSAKWLERKATVLKVSRLPVSAEMETEIDVNSIVEFYSR